VTTDDLKQLLKAGSGGDPELLARLVATLGGNPVSPFHTAVSGLFGLTDLTKSLPLQERKDFASVHLRQRRPKDALEPSDSPLAGRHQQRKIAKLLDDLAILMDQPDTKGTPDEDYVGYGDERTIDLRPNGTVEAISLRNYVRANADTKWTISVIRDVGSRNSWSVMPGVNVEEIKTRFVPPRLLVIVCLLTNPIPAGEKGVWGYDARLQEGAYDPLEWVSVYSDDREFLDLTVRIPKGSQFEFRRVELQEDAPGRIDFDSCHETIAVSRAGVAHHKFEAYTAGQARGFAWKPVYSLVSDGS
jgi:hypothetical protein